MPKLTCLDEKKYYIANINYYIPIEFTVTKKDKKFCTLILK